MKEELKFTVRFDKTQKIMNEGYRVLAGFTRQRDISANLSCQYQVTPFVHFLKQMET